LEVSSRVPEIQLCFDDTSIFLFISYLLLFVKVRGLDPIFIFTVADDKQLKIEIWVAWIGKVPLALENGV
jgi:hypothetical protein